MTGTEAIRIILSDVAHEVPATQLRAIAAETRRRMGEGGEWGDWIRTMGAVARDWGDDQALTAIENATGRLARLVARSPLTGSKIIQ